MANEFTPPNEFDRPNEIEQSSDRNLEPTPNKDKKHAKKAGDGTMGFMLWSIAGTVLAACSSPIFSDVADLTGGGGSSGDTQGGSPGFVTNGRWANTDIYVADENGTRDPNADAVGITDGAGNIIFNDEYINLDTLGNGERYMADLEGATEISTGRRGMSGEELLSLPYHGGVLIISPLTDLLANAYIETAPQDMTREEFYQVTLDQILGQRPQFDATTGDAITGTESSVVTVEDVLNADNYNPFADNNIAAELVSLASTTLGLIEEEASSSTTTERVAALTNSLDDTRGQLMTEADEDVLSFTLDSDSSIGSIDLDARVADRIANANSRPVVGNPNEGTPIRMTEDEDFVLSRANSNPVLLFGFEDPFDNDVDGQPGGEREPGQLVGIYIEAASMGGDIAVMFGDATNNVALAGADRVAASDAAIPATMTVGGVTFYFVSEANLDRLVLRPTDGDFNTADESVNNPQIRFYVHDGEHATLADGATTLDGVGMLEIEVANVNDAPVVNPPAAVSITSTSDSDLSGTFTASDADGDMDFRWSATPTSTPYGEFSFPDPANPGAWTFTLNEAAFDALPAGMDVPLTFDITANDGNGGVSDAATLTIMLQGQNDEPTDITTSVAALTASYDNDRIPDNGIFIATLSTEDADTGDTHTYTRGGVDGQYFSIRDGNGVISTEGTHLWLDSDAPGRVVGGTWEVVVTSTDSANAATSKTFSITRADASTNLAPTDITTTATGTSAALTATYDGNNVPDGGNGGHVVATLGTTDPNTGDTHTYSIVPVTGEASELFDINGNELILSVSASPAPGDMLEVTVRSTDAGGLMVDKTFTITRAGNADTATDTLAIASEGARTHLLIYGVEFRALEDGASGGHIFFPVNDGGLEDVSETSDDYGIHASTYSQASIADIWNTDTDTDAVTNNNNGEIVRQAYVATIIEEMSTISAPAGNTLAGWRTVEPGGAPVNNEANGRRPFIVGTDEADLVVTEGTSDLTARGWLQVTGATGDITFSRAGGTGSFTASGQLGSAAHTDTREYTFAGDYGDLVIDGDGDWVYTLGGTTAQNEALAALQSGGTERFVVAAMETGGAMRTVTETISIIVNEAPAPLAVASEGVREHLLIYGVEFRALVDAALPSGAQANYIFFTNDTVNSISVTVSGGYGIRTTDFSQANIADIWNNDLDNTKYVATIIEEMTTIPAGNTRDGWRTMEVGGAIVDSSGGRAFIAGTDEADRVVTEGSDLMASGWLQVTGGTGDITFRNGGTGGFTASGQLGGAAHTDTREYTFVGNYGDLVIDGDGDWVYTLGGTTAQDEAVEALTSLIGGAEIFDVEITRGGVMVDQEILITVNGVGESETGLVVTNEAVRAFVVINGVEFRVNDDSNNPARSDYEILFRAVSANSVITPNTAPGLIGVNITTAGNNDKFSQVNIARLFNGANLNLYDVAAIIREADESATERTITNWQSAETDFIYDFITASTALDFTVTEDDAADSTARGFLEVTGATDEDTYTYTGGTTTVIGTGTNAVTYQIFDGKYGELIVDGDGNWTYEIDNTLTATQALISEGIAAIDDFDVLVTQTAGSGTGTGTAMIDITVNGAAEAIDPVDALATAIALDNQVTTLAENAVDLARVKVADIDITDDGGSPGTLELAGSSANLFQIDGTELFLRQSADIDHETAPSLVVSVRLMEDTDVTSPDLTIEITNVDEGQASFSVTSSAGSDAPAEGHILTVARTTSDPDGDGTFTYEWQRGDAAGNNYVPIASATNTTYTIAAADVGNTLRVVVSYTDDGGTDEEVETLGVSVPAAGDLPATAIALTATAVTTVAEGETTRMKVADIVITDDGGSPGTLELAGANPTLFEIDLPNRALYLKAGEMLDFETLTTLAVRVQLMGNPSVSSPDLNISITNVDEGEARFNVTSDGADINAAVEGDTLTVTSDASNPDPDGNGTFTYQWERDGTPIDGAIGQTYTIARADEGTALTVVVSYTDAGGFSEAVETSPVAVPVDALATAIGFTGTVATFAENAVDLDRVKVADIDITDDGGRSGTLELVGTNVNDFFQIDGGVLYLRQGADIDHETAPSLVVSVRLMESTGVSSPDLTIEITNVDEGTASFSVTSSAGNATPVEGHILTAELDDSDPDGDGTFTYEWQRGDAAGNNYVAIAGATNMTYTIAAADEGNTLRVVVRYTDDGNKSETVTTSGFSVPAPADLPATAIALTATAVTTVDEGVSTRMKVADIVITDDGGSPGTLELVGTNADLFEIDLPNRALYLKAGEMLDFETLTTLAVRVQLMGNPSVSSADLNISITNVDEGEAGFRVTSNGADINAAVEGDVLTVSLDASISDPDGNGDGTLTYQWERNGTEITGETSNTYTIVRADEGTALTVVVSYTDTGGFSEAVETSPVNVPVDALATAITLTGTVNTLPEGPAAGSSRKVADIVITDLGGGRSGTLELAGTHSTLFEFGGTDNNELHLKGTVVLDHETAPSLVVSVRLMESTGVSSPDLTIEITNVDEGTASFSVTSSAGNATPVEGHILTAELDDSDPDGDGTFTYEWQRGDAAGNNYVAIAGATNMTYTIAAADEGNTLRVVVRYTDDGGNDEEVETSGFSVPTPTDLPATAIALTATAVTTVDEGVSTRMKVADIVITDDGGSPGTLELVGTNADLFEIDLPNRALYLKAGEMLDFETLTTLAVRVQLMGNPSVSSADLNISITNVDEGEAGFRVTSDGADINAAVEGDTLTVSLDASDPDGDGTFTYQWMRGNDQIAGATSNTYTIVRADEGTALTVEVTYTDAGGFSEAVTPSAVAVPVDDLATAITLTGTVTTLPEGPAAGSSRKVADIVITDPDGGRFGTLELAGTHSTLFEFGGTDNNELHLKGSVVLNHEDVLVEMLVVSVQLMEQTNVSSPNLTITVTNVDEGTASFSVTSSAGNATPVEGHILTAELDDSDPDGDGTFTYEWQRGDADGNNYVAIASATNMTYTIAAADVGNTLRVVVNYTDDGNNSETVTTSGFSVPAPADLDVTNEAVRAFVVINGVEFRVNDDRNASPHDDYEIFFTGGADSVTTSSGQSSISVNAADDDFSQTNIASIFNAATLSNLDIAAIILEADNTVSAETDWDSDEGDDKYDFSSASTTLDLAVTEDDGADETARGFLQVTGATDADDYTYTGDFEGKYGDLKIDPNGNWTYIIDNTDPLTQALDGEMSDTDDFTVTVRETGGAMRTEEVMIRITVNGAAEAAPMPVDTGDAVFNVTSTGDLNAAAANDTLTVLLSSTSDPDGIGPGGFRYQWQRTNANGDYVEIGTATGNTYTIVAADEGTNLRVIVSYTDGGGTDEAVETSAVSVPDVPDAPVVPMNGFYHLPATGGPPAYELPESSPENSRIVYSVGNVPTAPNFESRVLTLTTGTGVLVTVDENTGEWTAFPTGHITSFPSNGGEQAERNFYIHAHNVAAPSGTLGGLPVPAGENAQVEVIFNKVDIIADNTSSDVVDAQLTGYTGTSANELYIGTGGDDNIGMTRGGTDVIFARVGADTFSLGRNDSDTIYHRFSSSDSDWTNTDGGDTISGYVRSGANVANDTFIFVDTDTTVATEEDFAGNSNSNIEFYANIGLEGNVLEGFEIRFVNPTTGAEESTITINYHTALQPDITTAAQKEAFGILASVATAGEQEITDGTKFGHYFGDTPDAFRVIDDGDLPLAIVSIVADVI